MSWDIVAENRVPFVDGLTDDNASLRIERLGTADREGCPSFLRLGPGNAAKASLRTGVPGCPMLEKIWLPPRSTHSRHPKP